MQRVVAKFVVETGETILGVGSWISGTTFKPGSDFDMRLITTGPGSTLQHLERWQRAKKALTGLIYEEFGPEAKRIVERTNLYAPNQLMAGVEDAADAVERFRRLRTGPNLGYTLPVTESTPIRYTEGLYGRTAQADIQAYEQAKGRLFYNNNGTCVTGLSELVHLGEGSPGYTAEGAANTAGQWADHCLQEIEAGRGDKVAKYLERLERDLTKSRDRSHLPLDEAYRRRLRDIQQLLKSSPGSLSANADEVAQLVARGRAEAAVLRSYATAGPLRRAYLRVMLDGVAVQNKVGGQIGRLMRAAPDWVNAANALDCVVFMLGARATSEAIGRGDIPESLSTAASYLKWFRLSGFAPLTLVEIVADIRREAELGGFSLVASTQEPWDLMSGNYTALGRPGVDPDPRRKLTLADMVARFHYERQLEAIVMAHAIRAATLGLGTATEAADKGVAQAIFDRCWPVIRDAWRWERDALASEFLLLSSSIPVTPLLVQFKPAEVATNTPVAFEAVSADGKLGERLQRMREIMRMLYGPGSGVASNFYWNPYGDGTAEADWQRTMRFAEPGVHPVAVRLEVAPFTSHTEADKRLLERRDVSAIVDVEVEAGAERSADAIDVTDEHKDKLWPELLFVGDSGAVDSQDFQVTVVTRVRLVLRTAGLVAVPTPDWPETVRPPFFAAYEVRSGQPVHLSITFGASFQPEALRVTYSSNSKYICDVKYSKPSFSMYVERGRGSAVTGAELVQGGTYTLDFVPSIGDWIRVTPRGVATRTDSFTSPSRPAPRVVSAATHLGRPGLGMVGQLQLRCLK